MTTQCTAPHEDKEKYFSEGMSNQRMEITVDIVLSSPPSNADHQEWRLTRYICSIFPIDTLKIDPQWYTRREREKIVAATEKYAFRTCLIDIYGFSDKRVTSVVNQGCEKSRRFHLIDKDRFYVFSQTIKSWRESIWHEIISFMTSVHSFWRSIQRVFSSHILLTVHLRTSARHL